MGVLELMYLNCMLKALGDRRQLIDIFKNLVDFQCILFNLALESKQLFAKLKNLN